MSRYFITVEDIKRRLKPVDRHGVRVFGIPRGGTEVCKLLSYATAVADANQADILLDDIVDSGKTRDEWMARFPGRDFFAVIDKLGDANDAKLGWVVFPWEQERHEDAPHDAIRRLLQFIGEQPDRPGLRGDP